MFIRTRHVITFCPWTHIFFILFIYISICYYSVVLDMWKLTWAATKGANLSMRAPWLQSTWLYCPLDQTSRGSSSKIRKKSTSGEGIMVDTVSWEPEGRWCWVEMFRWEPEGRYRCTKSMAIAPFWLSTDEIRTSIIHENRSTIRKHNSLSWLTWIIRSVYQ